MTEPIFPMEEIDEPIEEIKVPVEEKVADEDPLVGVLIPQIVVEEPLDERARFLRLLQGTVLGIPTEEPTTAQEMVFAASEEELTDIFNRFKTEGDKFPDEPAEISTEFDIPVISGPIISTQRAFIMSQPGPDIAQLLPAEMGTIQDVTRSIMDAGQAPFETGNFNVESIKSSIRASLEGPDIISHVRLLSNIQDQMELGFKQTLAGDNPSNDSRRAMATLAIAMHEIVKEEKLNDPDVLNVIAGKAISNLVGTRGIHSLLRGSEIHNPEAISRSIFSDEIRALLDTENLSALQIDTVKRDFDKFLSAKTTQILRGKILDIPTQLSILDSYLEQNIKDENLRDSLRQDVAILRQRLLAQAGLETGRMLPSINVLDRTRRLLIQPSIAMTTISPAIDNMITAGEGMIKDFNLTKEDVTHQKTAKGRRLAAAGDENFALRSNLLNNLQNMLNVGITRMNAIADKFDIQVSTPTRARQRFHISLTTLGGKNKKKTISKNVFELMADLKSISTKLAGETLTFSRAPQPLDESLSSVEDEFFSDFKQLESIIPPLRKSRSLRTKVPRATGLLRFGDIKIFSTEHDSLREIEIPPTAKTGDVVKLATVLTMEDGILEDINGKLLVEITQNQADVDEIVASIFGELHLNAGHTIKLIYRPEHPVGGQFLDGFLSSIHNHPFIPRSVGGSMDSTGLFKAHPLFSISQIPIGLYTRFRSRF